MADVTAFPNSESRRALRRLLLRSDDVEVQGERPPKMGLYPLGEDVIISRSLYDLILVGLEQAAPADRAQIAAMMRAAYEAPFQP